MRVARVDMTDIAESIRRRLAESWTCEGAVLQIGASVGEAFAPLDVGSDLSLTNACDLALHAAKAGGHDVTRFFEPEMASKARRKSKMADDLRQGIERGEIFVVHQPQIRMRDGAVVGFEALARWRTGDGVATSPGEFVPIAEESGMIDELG